MTNYGLSIKGRRENNQDRFLIYEHDEETTFLAVADGIGGTVGGEIASTLVIDTVKNKLIETFNTIVDPHNLKEILTEIYIAAQKAIRDRIDKEPSLYGMGTTLCCLLIHKDLYVWGNVGDSRVYNFTNGGFHQITKDHSYIENLKLNGAGKHSNKIVEKYSNILTRSISGGGDEPDIYPKELQCKKLKSGEGFLLCSDGLLLEKNGNENILFNKILMESNSLKEFTVNLISDAYTNGSADNITCVSIRKGWDERKVNSLHK